MGATPIHVYHAQAAAICAQARELEPARTAIALSTEEQLRAAAGDIEVLLVDVTPTDIWASGHRLRLVQCLGAGADAVLPAIGLRDEAVVTCLRGVFAQEAAEHAIMLLLALRRGLPAHLARQRDRVWNAFPSAALAGDTLAVVGLGAIGSRVAALASAIGMQVRGVRRTGGADSLHEVLRSADHLVLTAPLTSATRGLIGATELALLPRTALVVNVARGEIVDEAALLAALRDGRIGGAALDVFASEPLPPDSAWWTAPNTIVTPHVAGFGTNYIRRAITALLENVGRLESGQPLLRVVDRTVGY